MQKGIVFCKDLSRIAGKIWGINTFAKLILCPKKRSKKIYNVLVL